MKTDPSPSFPAIVAVVLRSIWFFFPGILFIGLGFFAFSNLPQGQDLVLQSRVSDPFPKLLFIFTGLIFWAFTTWYTARILAYNEKTLFVQCRLSATWFPRLLGFLVFMVFGVAMIKGAPDASPKWCLPVFLIVNAIVFFGVAILRESIKRESILLSPRSPNTALIGSCISIVFLYFFWDSLMLALLILITIQFLALFWVSFRNPSNLIEQPRRDKLEDIYRIEGRINSVIKYIFNWDVSKHSRKANDSFFQTESTLFVVYQVVAILAVISYLFFINSINIGRLIGAFAFVLFAFGMLLGVGNLLTFFSYRNKGINLHFILISIVLILGNCSEPHCVQLISKKNNQLAYHQRDSFIQHLRVWISEPSRSKIIKDTNAKNFPLFFAIADGGASRSGFWTAIVLSKLHDQTKINTSTDSYFHRHLFCLAGASGGSVGNGTFLSALIAQQSNSQTPSYLYCKEFLDNDFLTYPLARLLGPELIKPVFNFKFWEDRAKALESSMEAAPYYATKQESQMAKLMGKDIDLFFRTSAYCPPIFCINVTRMQDGGPALISNIQIENSVFGSRLDVFKELSTNERIKVSTSLILGARFPYFSPAGRIGNSYFVDGGYFDNSGAGPVHEIILALEKLKNKYLSPQFKPQAEDSLLVPFLKKMRYLVFHAQNTPLVNKALHKVHPAINDLAAPVITLAGSYGAQTNVNNSRLQNYLKELQPQETSYLPINLYNSVYDKFPMSWAISIAKIDSMEMLVKKKPLIDSLIARMNRNQVNKLFDSLEKKQ